MTTIEFCQGQYFQLDTTKVCSCTPLNGELVNFLDPSVQALATTLSGPLQISTYLNLYSISGGTKTTIDQSKAGPLYCLPLNMKGYLPNNTKTYNTLPPDQFQNSSPWAQGVSNFILSYINQPITVQTQNQPFQETWSVYIGYLVSMSPNFLISNQVSRIVQTYMTDTNYPQMTALLLWAAPNIYWAFVPMECRIIFNMNSAPSDWITGQAETLIVPNTNHGSIGPFYSPTTTSGPGLTSQWGNVYNDFDATGVSMNTIGKDLSNLILDQNYFPFPLTGSPPGNLSIVYNPLLYPGQLIISYDGDFFVSTGVVAWRPTGSPTLIRIGFVNINDFIATFLTASLNPILFGNSQFMSYLNATYQTSTLVIDYYLLNVFYNTIENRVEQQTSLADPQFVGVGLVKEGGSYPSQAYLIDLVPTYVIAGANNSVVGGMTYSELNTIQLNQQPMITSMLGTIYIFVNPLQQPLVYMNYDAGRQLLSLYPNSRLLSPGDTSPALPNSFNTYANPNNTTPVASGNTQPMVLDQISVFEWIMIGIMIAVIVVVIIITIIGAIKKNSSMDDQKKAVKEIEMETIKNNE